MKTIVYSSEKVGELYDKLKLSITPEGHQASIILYSDSDIMVNLIGSFMKDINSAVATDGEIFFDSPELYSGVYFFHAKITILKTGAEYELIPFGDDIYLSQVIMPTNHNDPHGRFSAQVMNYFSSDFFSKAASSLMRYNRMESVVVRKLETKVFEISKSFYREAFKEHRQEVKSAFKDIESRDGTFSVETSVDSTPYNMASLSLISVMEDQFIMRLRVKIYSSSYYSLSVPCFFRDDVFYKDADFAFKKLLESFEKFLKPKLEGKGINLLLRLLD